MEEVADEGNDAAQAAWEYLIEVTIGSIWRRRLAAMSSDHMDLREHIYSYSQRLSAGLRLVVQQVERKKCRAGVKSTSWRVVVERPARSARSSFSGPER